MGNFIFKPYSGCITDLISENQRSGLSKNVSILLVLWNSYKLLMKKKHHSFSLKYFLFCDDFFSLYYILDDFRVKVQDVEQIDPYEFDEYLISLNDENVMFFKCDLLKVIFFELSYLNTFQFNLLYNMKGEVNFPDIFVPPLDGSMMRLNDKYQNGVIEKYNLVCSLCVHHEDLDIEKYEGALIYLSRRPFYFRLIQCNIHFLFA